MKIETERLIIRDLELTDAESLLKIKYDEKVLEYTPEFIKRDATLQDAMEEIRYFIKERDNGNFKKEIYYAVCLKDSGKMIGTITTSIAGMLREQQIGWTFCSEYSGNGYAAEAGCAVSDYLLSTFQREYLIVVMDVDNPASFKTAQKCGFRLFEKRVPYDYHYSQIDVEKPDEVAGYFTHNQATVGSCYYYFRKYNKNAGQQLRFYGDIEYTGRFS